MVRNNQLHKIENLEALTSLRELDLYDNQITALENLSLPSLTYLLTTGSMLFCLVVATESFLPGLAKTDWLGVVAGTWTSPSTSSGASRI